MRQVAKIFEKMILKEINGVIETSRSDEQQGFRSRKSTTDLIFSLSIENK